MCWCMFVRGIRDVSEVIDLLKNIKCHLTCCERKRTRELAYMYRFTGGTEINSVGIIRSPCTDKTNEFSVYVRGRTIKNSYSNGTL